VHGCLNRRHKPGFSAPGGATRANSTRRAALRSPCHFITTAHQMSRQASSPAAAGDYLDLGIGPNLNLKARTFFGELDKLLS